MPAFPIFSEGASHVANSIGQFIEPQTLKLANKIVANRTSTGDAIKRIGKSGITPQEAGASALEVGSYVMPTLGLGALGKVASSGMFSAAQPLGNKGKVSVSDVPKIATQVIVNLALSKLMGKLTGGEKAVEGPTLTQANSATAEHAARYFKGIPGDLQARAAMATGAPIQTGGYGVDGAVNLVPPMQGSVEQILESGGGWIPGMRQAFDTALMNGNKAIVQKLLPNVPKDYTTRFASEINQLLAH